MSVAKIQEPSQQLRVFLCRSSEDEKSVRKLYQRLRCDSFAPWLDDENLLPGQDRQQEIAKAVRLSDVVVVCLSQTSVTKEGSVQKEIKIALDVADEKPEGVIFIIPARLDEHVDVPTRLRRWQWVDLFGESDYSKLVDALNKRSEELGIKRADPVVKVHPGDGQSYVWIPPGTFQMGSPEEDSEGDNSERPAHAVTITKGFWLGQTPVTQAAYQRVMGVNPSHFLGEQLPVERVTWCQAKAYCEEVGGRLPTEAEWEFAARAGNEAPRYGELDAIAWFSGNSKGKTHEVGLKQPNRWKLYDMLGNVFEWVGDWYDERYYARSPSLDPPGPSWGEYRAVRGGSWNDRSRDLRLSLRGRFGRDNGDYSIGFRCALDVLP